MDEHEFQKKCDAAFETLRNRLMDVGDAHDFEVEGGSGKLEIEFEDEDETRFVIKSCCHFVADTNPGTSTCNTYESVVYTVNADAF